MEHPELYLEDFEPGQTFGSATLRVDEEAVHRFASEFDPQPHHLDVDAARTYLFGGLAASGWHTAAMTARLLVDSEMRPAGGIVGAGIDELRWPQAVRPGDTIHIFSEVVEVRRSRSRPDRGLLKLRTTTFNQNGDPVQVMIGNLFVRSRSIPPSSE